MNDSNLFTTVVADPPWPYENRVRGESLPSALVKDGSRRQISAADWTYDPMPLADICALPVRDWTERNSHLYLWVTNAFMRQGYDVVEAWGYTPKTIITWGKVKKDDPATASMKSGYYFRGATEHVIFATRGSIPKMSNIALPTLFLHPRIARHSEKPESFYTDFVEKVSPGHYLEMFARTTRPGWTAWGNQVEVPS